jgi:hypothetical protein
MQSSQLQYAARFAAAAKTTEPAVAFTAPAATTAVAVASVAITAAVTFASTAAAIRRLGYTWPVHTSSSVYEYVMDKRRLTLRSRNAGKLVCIYYNKRIKM